MSIFNDNKGFFQGNGSGGVKFSLGDGFKNLGQSLKKGLMGKPCAGQPGVCPYSCQPLRTDQEKAEGISATAKAQGATPEGQSTPQNIGMNATTGRQIMASPQAMSNPLISQQLNQISGLNNAPVRQMRTLGGGFNG